MPARPFRTHPLTPSFSLSVSHPLTWAGRPQRPAFFYAAADGGPSGPAAQDDQSEQTAVPG